MVGVGRGRGVGRDGGGGGEGGDREMGEGQWDGLKEERARGWSPSTQSTAVAMVVTDGRGGGVGAEIARGGLVDPMRRRVAGVDTPPVQVRQKSL